MMFAGRAGNNFTVYWHLCLTVACSCVIKSLKVGYTYLIFVTDAPTVSVEKKSVISQKYTLEKYTLGKYTFCWILVHAGPNKVVLPF